MVMNSVDFKALEWFKSKGYKENEIVKNSNSYPTFVCQDGKRYAVKFLYGNKVIFSLVQITYLKDSDIVLVFDRRRFITKFLWGDRKNISLEIKIINQNQINIQINKKTLEKLKTLRVTNDESNDDIINRLIRK